MQLQAMHILVIFIVRIELSRKVMSSKRT